MRYKIVYLHDGTENRADFLDNDGHGYTFTEARVKVREVRRWASSAEIISMKGGEKNADRLFQTH